MVQGHASVTFVVECSGTQPGEAVFVVGDHEALGGWRLAGAVPMATSERAFPVWCSEAVSLPAGRVIEFKFVILQEERRSPVLWEDFRGNRSLEVAPGTLMTVRAEWGLGGSTSTKAMRAPAGSVGEGGTLKKSTSGAAFVKAEMEQMSAVMADRSPTRRNFSQSLLCLDREASDDTDAYESEPEPATSSSAEPRGVPLHNVTSFSALTEMANAETKSEARRQAGRARRQYEPYNKDVPVVIVTSEIAPWSKSGGLGLVAASFSYEFARNGHRTMAVSPKYQHYEDLQYIGETRVRVDEREELVKYWHRYVHYGGGAGCDYVFVDHPSIERAGGLYNGPDGREYGDNLLRFTLLCAAAMEAPLVLSIGGYPYGDKVVFLANDWQSGLVPLYLSYKYRRHGCYSQARCLYVIHNLGYQGQYACVEACRFFGVDPQAAFDLVHGSCVNLSKGAIICADRVLTVSPNYAWEIQTHEGGFGLDDFVRGKAQARRLGGILNGIDDCWNPETDEKIVVNYGVEDFEAGKAANKAELQRRLGLRPDPSAVVLGFVGRLTWQKGVDVLAELIGWLMQDTGNGVTGRVQLIMMGNGEACYAEALRWAERAFGGRACGYVGFDPAVEHLMMAGLDLLLMPSRYEPCGLPQMYAQRYGTLPVVAATGGLVDSVRDISAGLDCATGFHVPYLTADKLKEVLYRAMEMYLKRPSEFRRMQRSAMGTDYYWPRAMDQYEQHIDYTLYDPPLRR